MQINIALVCRIGIYISLFFDVSTQHGNNTLLLKRTPNLITDTFTMDAFVRRDLIEELEGLLLLREVGLFSLVISETQPQYQTRLN
jgi:hypothetical protein